VAILDDQSGSNGLRFFGTPAQILARVRGLQRPTRAPVVDARDTLVPARIDSENRGAGHGALLGVAGATNPTVHPRLASVISACILDARLQHK